MGFSLKKVFKGAAKIGTLAATAGAYDGQGRGWAHGLGGGGGNGQLGAINGDFANARNAIGLATAQGLTEQRRAKGQVGIAYGGARKALASGRAQGVQAIQDQGARADANAQQSLANRGLMNSTILDNARAGNGANVSRLTADLDARYAQLLGELDIGQNQAENQITDKITSLQSGFGAQSANLYTQHANVLANAQVEDDQDWLGSLFQLGGQAFGYGLGGGFGGGGSGYQSGSGVF